MVQFIISILNMTINLSQQMFWVVACFGGCSGQWRFSCLAKGNGLEL